MNVQPTISAPSLAELLDYPVHPLAAAFPMMLPDELADLAEDIKTNGLNHPIVLFGAQLVDGRNRLAACAQVGVEPATEQFAGTDDDVTAFIISQNVSRRHLTASQRTMAVAVAYPEPAAYRRGGNPLVTKELNAGQLSLARFIIRSAPDLVAEVLGGGLSIDAAYRKAKALQTDAEEMAGKMRRLAEGAPDLHRKVAQGDVDIDKAIRQMEETQRKTAELRQRTTGYLQSAMTFLAPSRDSSPQEWATAHIDILDRSYFPDSSIVSLSAADARRCSASMAALADLLEKQEMQHTEEDQ